ncbi:hypothetical protein M2401_006880 [Pseudomonas sp. JUb42]|jgi:hypothetical protein|uniref:hypothetical protein n=1 Tax=Pseudomonas sp. JUb42 TaxID=2940611 RepID=UPI002166EEE9|nr:hypothetical protein [Pseudomonas sp. JUb42]MCS3473112.1 hypothetical protein [Pseudomonas sp. JUb42]
MQDFIHDDKTVEFISLVGEVVGSEKLNETHVSASGGGGYVGKNGGHLSAVEISSTNVINHEFWVRDDAGVEHDVKLRGHDIPLRTGQRITLIGALRKHGTGTYWYSVIVNHSANKHWFLKRGAPLSAALGLTPFNLKALMIGIALFIVLGYVTGAHTLAFLIGGGYFLYKYIGDQKRYSAMANRLDAHLESLAQQAYERDRAREVA